MRLLVTGHHGYIGSRLVPLLAQAGHDVVGMDSFLYDGCTMGQDPGAATPALRLDVRDATPAHLEGFDAVMHLAGISNDPLGDLRPETTDEVNHLATVHLARVAKAAGVPRFLFSSSCSLYGAAGDDLIDETAPFNPVTPYGWSKIHAEEGLRALADDDFSPVFLRNATVHGMSARVRGDLVVNNLVGHAVATGRVYLKSDGTPWRPLAHVEDVSRAFLALAEAPRDVVHAEAFNVGRTGENYRIRDVAAVVEDVVPGSRISFADSAGPDLRNYRVSCEKLEGTVPGYRPTWGVRAGVEELYAAFTAAGLSVEDLEGSRYLRIRRVQELIASGALDHALRWQVAPASVP